MISSVELLFSLPRVSGVGELLELPGISSVETMLFEFLRIFSYEKLFELPLTSSFVLLLVHTKFPSIGQLLNFLRLEVLGNV